MAECDGPVTIIVDGDGGNGGNGDEPRSRLATGAKVLGLAAAGGLAGFIAV